ncbi:MAG: VWA domain-containing protein [Victivallaceae bacterium]|nr:VWA domain-containing protein [Victivallaceae bacterium]
MRLYPLLPWPLIIATVSLSLFMVWLTWRNGFDWSKKRRLAMTSLRLASLAILFLMIIAPGITIRDRALRRSHIIFLLDGSESMAVSDVRKDTRFAAGLGTLQKLLGDNRDFEKHVYIFNDRMTPAEDRDSFGQYTPRGSTNLKHAFETSTRDLDKSAIAAAVIITDGLDQSEFRGTEGIPIFAVKTGTALSSVPDLRVADFKTPETVFAGEEISLSIPIEMTGFASTQQIKLESTVDGKTESEKTFMLVSGQSIEAPFKTILKSPGIHKLSFSLNQLDGEISVLNNHRNIFIEVKEKLITTLLYFPILNNSFRPLIRMMRDSGKKFSAVYKVREGIFQVAGNIRSDNFENGLPKSAEALKNIDLIVLGAGNASLFNAAEQKVLEQYLADGGNLTILGGSDSFGAADGNTVFNAMLPVRTAGARFADMAFTVAPPENSPKSFEEFTLYSGALRGLNLVDGIKSGSNILLFAQADKPYPLVVSMPYGRGMITAILSNSFHLWGRPEQRSAAFQHFWEQLLGHAGSLRDERLKFTVNATPMAAGEILKIKASAADAEFIDAAILPFGGAETHQTIRLSKDNNFYGEIPDLPEGQWILRLTAKLRNDENILRHAVINIGATVHENPDIKVSDEHFLRFTAHERIFLPHENKRLMDAVMSAVNQSNGEREWYPTLESPFFLLLLAIFLFAEWYLRRRFNMF